MNSPISECRNRLGGLLLIKCIQSWPKDCPRTTAKQPLPQAAVKRNGNAGIAGINGNGDRDTSMSTPGVAMDIRSMADQPTADALMDKVDSRFQRAGYQKFKARLDSRHRQQLHRDRALCIYTILPSDSWTRLVSCCMCIHIDSSESSYRFCWAYTH